MMITIKEARKAAALFAEEVLGPDRVEGTRLEEVEDDVINTHDVWVITLSFSKEPGTMSAYEQMMQNGSGARPRDYKTFAVDKETGRVISMKIRQLALS